MEKIDNAKRAIRAKNALDTYIENDTPDESHVRDLITDLLHMLHQDGKTLSVELRKAICNYIIEAEEGQKPIHDILLLKSYNTLKGH